MKPFEPKDKVVAITGASSGIGRACALAFARAGARVALIGRDRARLDSVQSETGGGSRAFQLDLQNLSQIPKTISEIRNQMGPVDILVNNAAYAVAGLVEDCPVEQYKKNFDVNFFAPLSLIQTVIPGMKQKKSGQIINIASGVGKRALPGFSSYCATKFALNGLTESLRLELKPSGIDVVSVSPGRVSSNFHKNIEFYGRWKVQIPEMNMRTPEKIARTILCASLWRCREVMVFGPGWVGYHLNYWAPRLVDWLLARKYPVVTPSPLAGEGRGEGAK